MPLKLTESKLETLIYMLVRSRSIGSQTPHLAQTDAGFEKQTSLPYFACRNRTSGSRES